MKNLLVVTRSTVLHNQSGGLETQLDALIEQLKGRYKITVLTTALPFKLNPPKINQTKIYKGVTYICLKDTIPGEYGFTFYETLIWQIPVKRNTYSFNKNFQRKAALYYKKKLRGGFDVVISQSSSAQKFLTDKPIISINHGTTLNEIKSTFAGSKGVKDRVRFIGLNLPVLLFEHFINNPAYFKKVSKIVLVSKSLQKDFARHHKRFANKVVVIENGVDTRKFKANATKYNKKPFKTIYFGRINYEKGLAEFIEVAKGLSKICFAIYGDGPDKKDLQLKLNKYQLANLKYYGPVSNDKIAKQLANSHIFLFLTKRKEGMPMSVLEAMSAGCVVVSTNTNYLGNKKLVVKGVRQGINVIKELESNRESFKRLSLASRKVIVNNYSIKIMGNKYCNLIDFACAQK